MKPPYISFVEGSDTDLWIWGLSHPDGTAVVESANEYRNAQAAIDAMHRFVATISQSGVVIKEKPTPSGAEV